MSAKRSVTLPYGSTGQVVALPEERLAGMIRPHRIQARSSEKILAQALAEPVAEPGSSSTWDLSAYLGRAASVLIVVNDATRPTPTALVLQHLESFLKERRVSVLVATGTHRPATQLEIQKILGGHASRLGPGTRSHDCDNETDLILTGRTSRGTPLVFHRAVKEAERVLVIGSVEPHYFAGWTGGRKGLMPGVAGRQTIEQNHRFALDPGARPMVLAGNPCHEDLEEGVRLLRPEGIWGMNLVLDREDRLCGAFCGELSASFDQAVKRARTVFAVEIAEKAEVVVSVAVPPLDNDLYQMQKAIEHGRLALKKGGILIAVSPCREGLGPSHYLRHLRAARNPEDVLKLASQTYSLGDHKAVKIAEVKLNGDLYAVTGLPPRELEGTFITPFLSLQSALDQAFASLGAGARVLFMTHGSVTVPVFRGEGDGS